MCTNPWAGYHAHNPDSQISHTRNNDYLTGMIGPIVGVEPPFTVQTIIRTVHKGRKRRTTIKITPGPDVRKSCMFMFLKMAREKYVFDKRMGTNYFAYI